MYCINLDTYSKLDVPTTPVKVSVDLDVLQILEVDDVKFTVAFSMYFGVRWEMSLYVLSQALMFWSQMAGASYRGPRP